MTENIIPQDLPQDPHPRQANLTETLFGRHLGQCWVTAAVAADENDDDAAAKLKQATWAGHFHKADKVAAFDPSRGHYFSIALMKPGSKDRNNANFAGGRLIVADDVGYIAPEGAIPMAPGAEVDVGLFDMFAPETCYEVETSPGNFQKGYVVDPPEPDFQRWDRFIKLLKQHPRFGKAFKKCTAIHYMRMETGSNQPKAGRPRFRSRLAKPYTGKTYTLDELAADFGIDIDAVSTTSSASASASPTGGPQQTVSRETLRAILDAMPPDEMAKLPGVDRGEWTGVCHAIVSANGDRDDWLYWCEKWSGRMKDGAAEHVWDTLPGEHKNNLHSLLTWVSKIHGPDSAVYKGLVDRVAKEQFSEIPGADGVAPPGGISGLFDLSEWNPWEQGGGPAFPVTALRQEARDWVETNSLSSGCDVSAFAMSAVMGVSTTADHRNKVKPKPHDGRLVSPLLWGMLCGDPSTRKSAPINAIEAILRRFDQHDWSRRKFSVDLLVAGGMSPKDAEAAVPPARRRVVNDVTTEALCEVLAGQDCGAGLFRDELSGWIGAMDKYGGGGKGSAQDRSVFIKAHEGVPYRQDRAKGSARIVNHLSCAIFGAIQPKRLTEMGKLDSDGLLQRFLPIMMAPAKLDADNVKVISKPFEDLLEAIDRLSPETYTLSSGAATVRRKFADEMTLASRIKEPSESFGSFLGKQERTLCAIALGLHLMDVAAGSAAVPVSEIPTDTMFRAEAVCRYLLKHAYLFYGSINDKWAGEQQSLAAALVRLAKAGKVKITKRDVDRTCQASRGMDMKGFQMAVLAFQANGWLVPEMEDHTNRAWFLNVEVATKFDVEYAEYTRMCENVLREITEKSPF